MRMMMLDRSSRDALWALSVLIALMDEYSAQQKGEIGRPTARIEAWRPEMYAHSRHVWVVLESLSYAIPVVQVEIDVEDLLQSAG